MAMTKKSDDIKAIREIVQAWHDGWQASDIESILSLFTDDPILLPPGQSPVFGREAIRSLYQTFFDAYTVKGECHVEEIEVSGDLGYVWVNYALTASPKGEGEPIHDNSKSLFLVRRQKDRNWKIARLMVNSNDQ